MHDARARDRRSPHTTRLAWWLAGLAGLAGVVYLMATASTGPIDPTEVRHAQSHATVVFNASMIVFREGLEAVLIFAAVTASFLGANRSRRRPVVLGAVFALFVTMPYGQFVHGLYRFAALVRYAAESRALEGEAEAPVAATGQGGTRP